MGVANVAGGAVRRVGRSAEQLEPEHRRDGLGLLLFALAVVVAAREWWGLTGQVGDLIHTVAAGTFGRAALVLPLVLIAFGVRLMRRPEDEHGTNRIMIGSIALGLAMCGLLHIVAGTPTMSDGLVAFRDGGGMIGYLAAAPLVAGIRTWGAVVLLLILAFFGLLVVTATPVHRIPERLREAGEALFGPPRPRSSGRDDDLAEPGKVRSKRGRRLGPERRAARRGRAVRAGRRGAPGLRSGEPGRSPAARSPPWPIGRRDRARRPRPR